MESRFRRGDDDDRFSSAAGGYFSFQAMQAGFMDGGAMMRPRPTLEALEMELREEMIKEEIIARRIAQRRMVEEQARREMEIAVAMGIGGGGRRGHMSSSVEPPLMLGPPEFRPRLGRRDHAPKKLSILEEVKETEDVERRFGPRLGPKDRPSNVKPGKKLTLLDEVKDNVTEEIEFARRDTEYEERDRLGTQLGRRDFRSTDEKMPLREEQGVEVGNKLPFRSKKMEVKTTSEIISQKLSGNKRKAVAAILEGASSSKFPRPAQKDWSCALCQVSATCEEGLNEHLQGRKHLAKVTQLGSKKNFAVTTPVKNSSEPKAVVPKKKPFSKVVKKVSIKVDGKQYEVVEKGRYLWCWLCRVKCNCQSTMIAHLSGKRHLLEESKNPNTIDTETSKEVVEDKKECTDSADKNERKVEAEQPSEKECKAEPEQPDEKECMEEVVKTEADSADVAGNKE